MELDHAWPMIVGSSVVGPLAVWADSWGVGTLGEALVGSHYGGWIEDSCVAADISGWCSVAAGPLSGVNVITKSPGEYSLVAAVGAVALVLSDSVAGVEYSYYTVGGRHERPSSCCSWVELPCFVVCHMFEEWVVTSLVKSTADPDNVTIVLCNGRCDVVEHHWANLVTCHPDLA